MNLLKTIVVVVFAVVAVQSLEAASTAPISFSKGMIAFSDNEYEKALGFFEAAHKEDAKNPDTLHLLGLTHLKLNHFSEASRYFKELLDQNPDYTTAHLGYAISLYHQKKQAEARGWFEKAGQSKQTETARVAKEWIEKIDSGTAAAPSKGGKEKKWNLRAAASFFYDSNVTLDPDDQNLTGSTHQEDIMGAGAIDLRYLLYKTSHSKLSAGYSGYQSAYGNLYTDQDRFNYGRHKGEVQFQHRFTDQVQWRIPVNFTLITLAKAKYVMSGAGESDLDFAWNENWLTTFIGKIRRDEFFANPTNSKQVRDALKPTFGVEQYFFFPGENKRYLKAGYEFDWNMASGEDWDYKEHHAFLGFGSPLVWGFDALLLGDMTFLRKFDKTDSVFSQKRDDFSVMTMGVLSHDIAPHLRASGSYTFAMTDSNIGRYKYQRHISGLTLSTQF